MSSDRAEPPSRAATLALVGCELAFDFTNTTSGRGGPRQREHLRAAEDIIVWAHHAKIIGRRCARELGEALAHNPRLASRLRRRALELRTIVYRLGAALAAGAPAPPRDVDALAKVHAHCLSCAHLTKIDGVYAWRWQAAARPVEAILGPIALSALGLLSQADLSRVKQCPGEACGWLFFDTTKNKNRRWCEMEVCGNRAKQRRLRSRQRPR
jgi:predicted RNA-binding Zn ribbon-like protein